MSAYIVAAARTAAGRNRGSLRNVHPVTLGGAVLNGLLDKCPSLDPALVDDVIFGCVSQAGEKAGNVARQCVLSSNLPESVPGTTVDRQVIGSMALPDLYLYLSDLLLFLVPL